MSDTEQVKVKPQDEDHFYPIVKTYLDECQKRGIEFKSEVVEDLYNNVLIRLGNSLKDVGDIKAQAYEPDYTEKQLEKLKLITTQILVNNGFKEKQTSKVLNKLVSTYKKLLGSEEKLKLTIIEESKKQSYINPQKYFDDYSHLRGRRGFE